MGKIKNMTDWCGKVHADLDNQDVARSKLGLKVLRAAKTFKLTIDHDGQFRTQRLALFHAATYKYNT